MNSSVFENEPFDIAAFRWFSFFGRILRWGLQLLTLIVRSLWNNWLKIRPYERRLCVHVLSVSICFSLLRLHLTTLSFVRYSRWLKNNENEEINSSSIFYCWFFRTMDINCGKCQRKGQRNMLTVCSNNNMSESTALHVYIFLDLFNRQCKRAHPNFSAYGDTLAVSTTDYSYLRFCVVFHFLLYFISFFPFTFILLIRDLRKRFIDSLLARFMLYC